jgi:MFS transporter
MMQPSPVPQGKPRHRPDPVVAVVEHQQAAAAPRDHTARYPGKMAHHLAAMSPAGTRGPAGQPGRTETVMRQHVLVAAGRLGDQFGRRRSFCLGLAVLVVTSAWCGLAPDATTLVLARLAQRVGGALLAPNVLSIIGVAYPGPARARAVTIYGLVMGLAAAGGQLIGADNPGPGPQAAGVSARAALGASRCRRPRSARPTRPPGRARPAGPGSGARPAAPARAGW